MRFFYLPRARALLRPHCLLAQSPVASRAAWRLPALLMALFLGMPQAFAATQCTGTAQYGEPSQRLLDPAGSSRPNLCIRDMHEGRAAVRLPPAGQNIDDVVATHDLQTHRWGFLDSDGHLAIKPVFERVEAFHHGLAAARDGDKWGYVDRQGRWAVQPRFDLAGAFTSVGLALVREDERLSFIDRKGDAVGSPLSSDVQNAYLGDGKPARLAMAYKNQYISPQGRHFYAPPDVQVVGIFSDQGLFVVSDGHRRYGLMDDTWQWIVPARYRDIDTAATPESLTIAEGSDEMALIAPDGKLVVSHADNIRALGRDFWLVQRDRNDYSLLDAAGKPVQTFDRNTVADLRFENPFVLQVVKEGMVVYAPGHAPVSVPGAVAGSLLSSPDVLVLRNAAGTVTGLVTSDGAYIDDASGAYGLAQIDQARVLGQRIWLYTNQGTVLNIIDRKGHMLLDPSTVKTLANYRSEPLEHPATDGPTPAVIAIVEQGPGYCGCDAPGAGLLLSDGRLNIHADWTAVAALSGDDIASSSGVAPAQRFAITTAQGTAMVGPDGQQILPFGPDHIGPFKDGYALVYRQGVPHVLDSAGALAPLPDFFAAQIAGPALLRFRETAAADAPWGLYDITDKKVVLAPALSSIGDFQNGLAVATDASGKKGVIDAAGHWAIPADYAALRPLTPDLWKVQADAGADGDAPTAIMDRAGQQIVPFTSDLSIDVAADHWVTARKRTGTGGWLFRPDGRLVVGGDDIQLSRTGAWISVFKSDALGYVNPKGGWAIAPTPGGWGSEFDQASGHALWFLGETSRIIDGHGKTVASLPGTGWDWPSASAWAVRHVRDGARQHTLYADASGHTVLELDGNAGVFEAGRAVTLAPRGVTFRWVDKQGRAVGWSSFDDLGVLADGLAYAQTAGLYGFVDDKGRFVIPPVYSAVSPFSEGRAVVSTPLSSMMIDKQGRPLARVVQECGVMVLYDADNRRAWPAAMPEGCAG